MRILKLPQSGSRLISTDICLTSMVLHIIAVARRGSSVEKDVIYMPVAAKGVLDLRFYATALLCSGNYPRLCAKRPHFEHLRDPPAKYCEKTHFPQAASLQRSAFSCFHVISLQLKIMTGSLSHTQEMLLMPDFPAPTCSRSQRRPGQRRSAGHGRSAASRGQGDPEGRKFRTPR